MRNHGDCKECGDKIETTGRNTPYCPSCNTCPDCGCPQVDGFAHYGDCKGVFEEEEERVVEFDLPE